MASEEDKAHAAAAAGAPQAADEGAPTIFDKIISKEIPSKIVFEDDSVLAFRDISPQGPVHIILIPKVRDGLTQLSKAEDRHEQVLGHLLVVAAKVARQEKLEQGFRLVINDGPHGSQSVYHLHLHLIGGRQMKWPPG
jgi:histidine triad (HIT) family protein